jgi:hypothetical protein
MEPIDGSTEKANSEEKMEGKVIDKINKSVLHTYLLSFFIGLCGLILFSDV